MRSPNNSFCLIVMFIELFGSAQVNEFTVTSFIDHDVVGF